MSSGEHQSPVLTEEAVDHAFADLGTFDVVVLAVSGGPDSTALMHLVAEWKRRRGAHVPDIRVATVDHGLRAGSAEEAEVVARAASALGFAHHVLRLTERPTGEFSQSWARDRRYQALIDLAQSLGGRRIAIVTAHTRDDQAETMLMRLGRGSGVEGLGAMRPVRRVGEGVWLVRPLLDVSKDALRAWLEGRAIGWIEDPSNAVGRFERVRLRARRAVRDELGLGDDKLALSAMRLRRANAALDAALSRAIGEAGPALVLSPLGFADVDRDWLLQLDEELRIRLMIRLIASTGGQVDPVPLGSLEARLDTFVGAGAGQGGFTLAGAQIDPRGARVLVCREPGDNRVPMPTMALSGSGTVMWDNRFILTSVGFHNGGGAGLTVGPLLPVGLAELETRGWQRPARCPAQALWSQPALRALNVVRWAPTLDFGPAQGEPCPYRVAFDWSRLDGER